MLLAIFWQQSYSQNSIKNITQICSMLWKSNSGSKANNIAPPALPFLQHPYYTMQICERVDYMYMSLRLILLQCKWMRLNQHDRIRQCSQKFATWKSLRLRSKTTSWYWWCRIGKWHYLKTRRFKTPTCFFRHPRRIFLENFESHRRVLRSAAWRCERRAHRDRKLFLRANLLQVPDIRL